MSPLRSALVAAATLTCTALPARAADVGNIAIVEDVGNAAHLANEGLLRGIGFCREAAKAFYATHTDDYDWLFLVTPYQFSTFTDVAQGVSVQSNTQGIGLTNYDWRSDFGNPRKLQHCAFLSSLGSLPDDPNGDFYVNLGIRAPLGITGVELLGHELGHHWLVWLQYDKADGQGKKPVLRQVSQNGETGEGSPNGHYAFTVDSQSVMYGNFLQDLGGGQFRLAGGDRKYGPLDQYLMGLRSPAETPAISFVDDGSGGGNEGGALQKGSTHNVQGTRVDVSVADIVRAEGPRIPDSTTSQKCFKAAFVLVMPPGQQPSLAMIQKWERYRARFQAWFPWATDDRAQIKTAFADFCPLPDGGVISPPDAGPGPVDAGPRDAGPGPTDAGAPDSGPPLFCDADPDLPGAGCDDGGLPDAGEQEDAGLGVADAGKRPKTTGDDGLKTINDDDCGCASTDTAFAGLALLVSLSSLGRRKRA